MNISKIVHLPGYISIVFFLVILLLAERGFGDVLIHKNSGSTEQLPDNKKTRQHLLITGNTNENTMRHSLSAGDLVVPKESTELRRSRAINNYNVLRLLSPIEIATIERIVGNWVQVQTESSEFGWVLATSLKKIKARQAYTDDWTTLIGRNTGAIKLCTKTLRARNPGNQDPKTIYIDPGLTDTTIILFWASDSEKAYRCTSAAYGGEVYRLEAFSREDIAPAVFFVPAPGQPSDDKCYSNEVIVDRSQRSIGWLSSRICR